MEIKQIKKLIDYNKHTGVFTWKPRGISSFDTKYAGKVAGCRHVSGRGRESWSIKINGKKYYAHILAWAYAENKKNLPMRSDNTSGTTGVYYCRNSKRYIAFIYVDRKKKYIGQYKNKEDAVNARKEAQRVFGYHANHGS